MTAVHLLTFSSILESSLVRDAIASGQVVLVAETRTEQETAIAREVIQALVGDSKDTNMA